VTSKSAARAARGSRRTGAIDRGDQAEIVWFSDRVDRTVAPARR
jgi:hypothetical protein